MRVVLDTNVLISALIFGGKPETALQMASLTIEFWRRRQ
jgi:predicted nucleic acid-binding protein